ncbi:MAG: ATP-binding cassette domain-containing protein [Cellulophaga sp.]
MTQEKHWTVFINNTSNKSAFIKGILNGNTPPEFSIFKGLKGTLFSKLALHRLIDLEERHGEKTITKNTGQSLKSMSSGEQKKALLKHILKVNPGFIILDNPFDNLDLVSQKKIASTLKKIAKQTILLLIISRSEDLLPFATNYASLKNDTISFHKNETEAINSNNISAPIFKNTIPKALHPFSFKKENLIILKNVTVSYGEKRILNSISWEIKQGEFWQLIGKNGSGKSTLLSMIIGENSKGYGQELYIFGQKKGSGESIWDIKKKIGYFTPAMTDKFSGHHTVENMIISGLYDSVGLYIKPTETQLNLAKEWLTLINLLSIKNEYFHDLSAGQQRLIMTVRAMIKHPLLLILDEPTAGLDDQSAALFVVLVNKIATDSKTAIIFVSHRKEDGLTAHSIFNLQMSPNGSTGNKA